MKKTDPPIVVEKVYSQATEKVWQALTVAEEMKQWFFAEIPAFEARVGFFTEFDVQSEGRNFRHQWTIREAEAGRKITYHWQYEEYPGEALVEFLLTPIEGGTRLTLTNSVLADFPGEVPEFNGESCRDGWEYFLGQNLKAHLEHQG